MCCFYTCTHTHTQKVQEKPMCVKSVQASPHKSTPPTLPQNNEQEVGTKRKLTWKKDHLFLRSNSYWMIILKYLSKRGLTRGTLVGIWLHKQSVFLQSFSFPFHESMIQFQKMKVRFFFCTANTSFQGRGGGGVNATYRSCLRVIEQLLDCLLEKPKRLQRRKDDEMSPDPSITN